MSLKNNLFGLALISFFLIVSCSLSDKMNSVVRTPDNHIFSQDQLLISGNIIGEPDWSPDSQNLVLSLDGDIFIIDTKNYSFYKLFSDTTNRYSPKWSPNGKMLAFDSVSVATINESIYDLSLSKFVTNFSPQKGSILAWSPDGKTLLRFIANHVIGSAYIFFRDVQSGSISSNIFGSPTFRSTHFQYFPDGTKILFTKDSYLYGQRIATVNHNGVDHIDLTTYSEDHYPYELDPNISFDGKMIAYITYHGISNYHSIWIMNSDGSGQHPLTSGDFYDRDPNISPDGTKIAFISDRNGSDDIWIMNADGSDTISVTDNSWNKSMLRWSPDGSMLLYLEDGDLKVLKK